MITNGKIDILDNILIDNELPKYKDSLKTSFNNTITIGNNWVGDSFNGVIVRRENSIADNHKLAVLQSLEYMLSFDNKNLLLKLRIWLYKNIIMNSILKPKKVTFININQFFESIKQNVSEIDKKHLDDVLEGYMNVIENAKSNNQTALVERIFDYAKTLQEEVLLCTSKFNKYLTEDSIVKFYNLASVHGKYDTKLKLTYIKNFVKVIPNDVTELKKEADKLNVFDNYVILHYDYSGDGVAETKEEIAKRKDPILFGLIKNSRNLYYIGDWIDDYCDLTLDVIIKKIGKNSVNKIDYKSIKNNINKI